MIQAAKKKANEYIRVKSSTARKEVAPDLKVAKEEERKISSIYKFQIDKQYKIELTKPD